MQKSIHNPAKAEPSTDAIIETIKSLPPINPVPLDVYLVVDTNFFLHDLQILSNLAIWATYYQFVIVIPKTVIHELDSLKNLSSKVGPEARAANNWIYTQLANNSKVLKIQKDDQMLDSSLVQDDAINDCCKYLKTLGHVLVVLLSNDKNLCVKALAENILTVSYVDGVTSQFIAQSVYGEAFDKSQGPEMPMELEFDKSEKKYGDDFGDLEREFENMKQQPLKKGRSNYRLKSKHASAGDFRPRTSYSYSSSSSSAAGASHFSSRSASHASTSTHYASHASVPIDSSTPAISSISALHDSSPSISVSSTPAISSFSASQIPALAHQQSPHEYTSGLSPNLSSESPYIGLGPQGFLHQLYTDMEMLVIERLSMYLEQTTFTNLKGLAHTIRLEWDYCNFEILFKPNLVPYKPELTLFTSWDTMGITCMVHKGARKMCLVQGKEDGTVDLEWAIIEAEERVILESEPQTLYQARKFYKFWGIILIKLARFLNWRENEADLILRWSEGAFSYFVEH